MLSKLLSSKLSIYHTILFLSFCLSVNYFKELEYINYLAYVMFHLTLIYLVFYFFHFTIFFITFLYGIFFDIFLINNISPHLISFLLFILLYYYTKRYLLNFSSNGISYLIYFVAISMFLLEALIADIFLNFTIKFDNLGWLFLSTTIIFVPLLFFFSRIDKL